MFKLSNQLRIEIQNLDMHILTIALAGNNSNNAFSDIVILLVLT